MGLRVACPAKLNLFLAVGPPDPTGYHPVRTLMQAVSLFDYLTIEPAERDQVLCDWPGFPADDSVSRAMRLLREFGDLPPLRISLEKRIPPESGLGGGSSDAAGLLRAAGRFSPTPFSTADLREVALAIGVDTAFFLVGGRARAEGYGERLLPLPDREEPEWYAIVRPEIGCPTGPMYRALDRVEREFRSFPESDEAYNDFESVAPRECLEAIAALRAEGARRAGLSGSGSAAYGVFSSEQSARRAAGSLGERFPFAWAARSLDRHESLQAS